MKKFLALLISVLFVFSFACAEAFTPVGVWYLIEMSMGEMTFNPADVGMEMVMTLNEDGTGLLSVTGEEEDMEATWVLEGDVLSFTTLIDSDVQSFSLVDGMLYAEIEGMTFLMSQEAPVSTAYIPAAPVAAADVTAFDGEWIADCFYMEDTGTTAPFSMIAPLLEAQLGTDLSYITISNGIVDLIPEQPGSMYFDGVFSNGQIIVPNPSDPTQIVVVVELLEDGMMCMTINGSPMYYAPVIAE